MSREIKFRVWGKTEKEYIRYPFAWLSFFDDPNGLEIEENENLVIEQYTGLKDKNGKEIYEGDIVKTKAGDILQVDSLTHSGWFATGIKSHNEIQLWLLTIDDCIEIIGNIHENSELLEGKK